MKNFMLAAIRRSAEMTDATSETGGDYLIKWRQMGLFNACLYTHSNIVALSPRNTAPHGEAWSSKH